MAIKNFQEEFTVSSSKRTQLIDITGKVERLVKASKIKSGLCIVFVPHATAAVIMNENESGLVKDMEDYIKKNFPVGAGYAHDKIDDNADAHVASAFIGQSRMLPIKDGTIVRGTWQNIFVVELYGPRNSRRVVVSVVGK